MFGLTHETKMVLKALEQTLSEHGDGSVREWLASKKEDN